MTVTPIHRRIMAILRYNAKHNDNAPLSITHTIYTYRAWSADARPFRRERDLREVLKHMQTKLHMPVCSTSKGWRIAVKADDMRAQARRLARHGLSELKRANQTGKLRLSSRLMGQLFAQVDGKRL